MILKGNQRGSGRELALHLMNVSDNEHAVLHDLRGFVAEDLLGAFKESEAVSLGTKCQQYLFSLSLNPPPDADVSIEAFEAAIADIESKLGLTGQPRAIVFHEKKARRHAHCVWSRIDPARMRAINLPHFKRRLQDVSRELYRQHGWDMPAGFSNARDRDPNAYSQTEAAQAKTAERDPKALKAMFRECWERTDSRAALSAALLEQGFVLAQGSRRSFVAVDAGGTVYSLSRWTGAGSKAVRARLGLPDGLPSIEEAVASLQVDPELKPEPHDKAPDIRLAELVARQRVERVAVSETQETRATADRLRRTAALPSGLRAAWAKITGQFDRHMEHLRADAESCTARDRQEVDAIVARHLSERRALQAELDRATAFERMQDDLQAEAFARPLQHDPRQRLVLTDETDLPSMVALELRPDVLFNHLTDKSETFSDLEIGKALGKISNDAAWRNRMTARLLASPELVPISSDIAPLYTTRAYQQVKANLVATAKSMAAKTALAVSTRHARDAIAAKNADLATVGASLSDEQTDALSHILSSSQLSCIVGYAGAGKSTLLDAARQAWEAQGYHVYGAALAGKAADGLQEASGVASRTLASMEASWSSGYEPVPQGSIVVIDEVGMVGTRQLEHVLTELQKRGCKAVLVGDPDQLQPIQAGTPFRDLLVQTDYTRLTSIRRQTEDWQRAASVDLAEGRVEMALQDYAEHGCVRETATRDHAIAALVEDYLTDLELNGDNTTRLALTHRRKDVFALNQGIRSALRVSGDLADEVFVKTEHGPRAFAAGDRISFTRNNAQLGLRNGMLGTVTDVGDNQLQIEIDGSKRTVSIDVQAYSAVDHGYAVSIHKSQGCTVDRCFVLSSSTMDHHLTYVALTRHRSEARLYIDPTNRPQSAQASTCLHQRNTHSLRRSM